MPEVAANVGGIRTTCLRRTSVRGRTVLVEARVHDDTHSRTSILSLSSLLFLILRLVLLCSQCQNHRQSHLQQKRVLVYIVDASSSIVSLML